MVGVVTTQGVPGVYTMHVISHQFTVVHDTVTTLSWLTLGSVVSVLLVFMLAIIAHSVQPELQLVLLPAAVCHLNFA